MEKRISPHHEIIRELIAGPASRESIDRVCELLFEIITQEPTKALEYLKDVDKISSRLSYGIGSAYIAGLSGYAYFMLSDFSKALPLMLSAPTFADISEEHELAARLYLGLANIYISIGMYAESIENTELALEISVRIHNKEGIAWSLHAKAMVFQEIEDHQEAILQFENALSVFNEMPTEVSSTVGGRGRALTGIGTSLMKLGEIESALEYHRKALELFRSVDNLNGVSRALNDIALCLEESMIEEALEIFHESLGIRETIGNRQAQCTSLIHIANLRLKQGDPDEALAHATRSLKIATEIQSKPRLFQSHQVLARIHEHREDWKQALHHFREHHTIRSVITGEDVRLRLASEQMTRQSESARKDAEIARLKTESLSIKNVELRDLLEKLKRTQAQLVQSEKLASLGQLTAGIAHEIRNPLNFIINFGSLNSELLDELSELIKDNSRGQVDSQLLPELLADLVQNNEKINKHGSRADRIVSNMLNHARSSSSEKESVDINQLTQEYAELACQGIRAANPALTFTLVFNLDSDAGTTSVVRPDIGRVILNLVTNACHSVEERKKDNPEDEYTGCIEISTKVAADSIQIDIRDNGLGILPEMKEKIFNPFFTTKSPGEGTGLGLSISHDIISGGHGGSLELVAGQTTGACFRISLPRQ